MRCGNCQKELSENALFCPDCGMKIDRSGFSENLPDPMASVHSPILNTYDESDYYHIDATETPDFEAMRGISIVLIVASAFSFLGILFPMPLAIVSLVKACTGVDEKNPYAARRAHDLCRTLVIISIIGVILIWTGLFAFFYLRDA